MMFLWNCSRYAASGGGTTESSFHASTETVKGPECVCVALLRMFASRTPVALWMALRQMLTELAETNSVSTAMNITCATPSEMQSAEADNGSWTPSEVRGTCGYPARNMGWRGVT